MLRLWLPAVDSSRRSLTRFFRWHSIRKPLQSSKNSLGDIPRWPLYSASSVRSISHNGHFVLDDWHSRRMRDESRPTFAWILAILLLQYGRLNKLCRYIFNKSWHHLASGVAIWITRKIMYVVKIATITLVYYSILNEIVMTHFGQVYWIETKTAGVHHTDDLRLLLRDPQFSRMLLKRQTAWDKIWNCLEISFSSATFEILEAI